MKKILMALCIAAVLFSLTACGKKEEAKAEKKGYKIAFSNSYVGNEWRTACVNIFNAYTSRLVKEGVIESAYCSSAGDDVQAQINEVRNMMSQGYDAIVTIAASATGLTSVFEEAADRGIVVVAFDATVESDKVYNVNTDQIKFGYMLADWLAKAMNGKGNILWIKGIEGTAITNQRTEGAMQVFRNYPNIKVLGEGFGRWNISTAYEVMTNLMSAYKSQGIDGVFCEGGGGHAIVMSLQENGFDVTKIPIAEGEFFNAYMEDWVKLGLNTFTTAQPPYLVAAAVDVALKVLNGEEVDKLTLIPTPTCSSREEAEKKWYQPNQSGAFVCDWTDNDNSYKLSIEEVAPK
jgi:ribose transport system substrate-binding protein